MNQDHAQHDIRPRTFWRSRYSVGLIVLGAIERPVPGQRQQKLAVAGPYAQIRHPQYVAFVLILLGFLLQWPTLLTLLMFPILMVMYLRLAITEEAEMRKQFGSAYESYAAQIVDTICPTESQGVTPLPKENPPCKTSSSMFTA